MQLPTRRLLCTAHQWCKVLKLKAHLEAVWKSMRPMSPMTTLTMEAARCSSLLAAHLRTHQSRHPARSTLQWALRVTQQASANDVVSFHVAVAQTATHVSSAIMSTKSERGKTRKKRKRTALPPTRMCSTSIPQLQCHCRCRSAPRNNWQQSLRKALDF